MNAKITQKVMLQQAEEEFGLIDRRPELVQIEAMMAVKTAIQLSLAEEIQAMMVLGQESGEVVLGFQDAVYGLVDNIKWDIKTTFLDNLVKKEVLISSERGDVWSEDALGWISVIKFSFDLRKSNELQKVVNFLAAEVKKKGGVRLIENEVKYNQQARKIIFNGLDCLFEPESATEMFLQYLFQLEPYQTVDWGDLFLYVFGDHAHMDRENRGVIQADIQKLEAIKDSINRRVKNELSTPDLLFRIKNRQYYRCF